MKKFFIILTFLTGLVFSVNGQIIIISTDIARSIMPEHGFLPGKKFKFYSTINHYDFAQTKFRLEVYDDRNKLKLNKIDCSDIQFTNTSEFAESNCIELLAKYVDTLFSQSNAIVDSAATDTVQIHFEGIDSRLIGFGKIRAHGLCQIKVNYHDNTKNYCIDITDADKNSPVGKNAFVTRKTDTRIIGSAAMREVIELFLKDLLTLK